MEYQLNEKRDLRVSLSKISGRFFHAIKTAYTGTAVSIMPIPIANNIKFN
jgi:hypothetical protein